MGRVRRGKLVKKLKALNVNEPLEVTSAPHSIIINHGKVGKCIKQLIRDMREVMEPYTATEMQVGKRNTVKDFLSIAGVLHVSHLLIFTKTEIATYLHIVKTPQGPTLTFRVNDYALAKDVKGTQKKPSSGDYLHRTFPLAILNSFSQEGKEMKLMTSMLQNMFPSINPNKVNFKELNRTVLFNYSKEDKTIDFRHYAIKVVPHGLGKAVKKLMQSKVPDMSKLSDISDFVLKPGQLSDTEYEQDSDDQVTLNQDIKKRGVAVGEKNALRLIEIGPRLTLELIKVVQGAMSGEVLYHANINRTEEQIMQLNDKRADKEKLREARRKVQQENVRRKEEKKKQSKPKKKQDEGEMEVVGGAENEEDDADWFRKEVGAEPDKDTFPDRKPEMKKRKSDAVADKEMPHDGDKKRKRKTEEEIEEGKANKKVEKLKELRKKAKAKKQQSREKGAKAKKGKKRPGDKVRKVKTKQTSKWKTMKKKKK